MSRIKITSKTNVVYTLEFDRKSASIAERTFGFSTADLIAGKLTYFPQLFQAAFLKHHPKIRPSVVNGLFDEVENKQELFEALTAMYAECVSSLIDEPAEGNGIGWEME